jgi:hypothetical protein
MSKIGISDDGPTAVTAKSYNPEAVPTVVTTLGTIVPDGEVSCAPQPIQSLLFEAEPITAEACTDAFGTTPSSIEASYSLAMDPVEVTFSRVPINATQSQDRVQDTFDSFPWYTSRSRYSQYTRRQPR